MEEELLELVQDSQQPEAQDELLDDFDFGLLDEDF